MNDDSALPMTFGERFAWGFAILTPLIAAIYFAVVIPQLSTTPVADVAWQVPMLVAAGAIILVTIVGTIVGVILGVIAGGISSAVKQAATAHAAGEKPEITIDESDFADSWASDIRDKEIERLGDRASHVILGVGAVVVVALAMARVDQFYIGNAMFAAAIIGAVVGSIAKIRVYREAARA